MRRKKESKVAERGKGIVKVETSFFGLKL